MSGIETALLKLAVSASNALFASWLRGKTPGARPDESIAQLLSRRVPSSIQRRRAQRQLDQVADQVAERLQGFIQTEFGHVPQNEVLAAAALVSDLFDGVQTDPTFLIASDLDAVIVERHLRTSGSHRIASAALSEAGEFLFNQILRETAAYTIEVFTVLPEFSSRIYKEILRRETALAAMAEQVLTRLPTADEQLRGRISEDGSFETEYRRNIARKFDRLELFGATISEFSRRYTLSVAYISLSLSGETPSEFRQSGPSRLAENVGNRSSENTHEVSSKRVEEVLGYGGQRVLVRGEAGSGKTTLLHWLSVMSARKGFSRGLKSWNNRVPVYLPLRRYASSQLPRPEQFLELVLPGLAGSMPPGWMHRLLGSENGLLLLDGVDELPGRRRHEFSEWFSDLISQFPNMAVIVTSRPTALESQWLRSEGVQSFELQPMSLQDSRALIDHWHFAVGKDIEDEDEQRLLASYRENLKVMVEERRPIRSLATNPLMCALICALHRDRRAHLPQDRMELYRIALEMLLERRDRERQVQDLGGVDLTQREKEVLFGDMAYWFIRNGLSDATIDQIEARIKRMLPQIPHVKQTPKQILVHLLERSGLLRSPVEGRIDFLHRSFEEFLAAKVAVENDDIPLLVKNGTDDQWREVIILAAGHARPKERESLIRGILARGRAEEDNRHRLFLVAVACLETSNNIGPELRREVEDALGLVVPPKNQTDAAAIAAAGELATPFLANHAHLDSETVAACVHALAQIGDTDAMKVIQEYAQDRRPEVAREIVRSWPSFPAEVYARKILAKAPLNRGSIELSDSSYVEFVGLLTRVRRVQARRLRDDSLRRIGSLPRIRHLHIGEIRSQDFTWVSNTRLETLILEEFTIESWDGIDLITGLRHLSLRSPKFAIAGSPKKFANLESLELTTFPIKSLNIFSNACPHVKSLHISECPDLVSLRGIESFDKLEEVQLDDNIGLLDIHVLPTLPNLRKVSIRGGYISDLSLLAKNPQLEILRIDKNTDYSLGDLRHKPNLRLVLLD